MKYRLSKVCIVFGLLAVLFLHYTVKIAEADASHHSHIHADAGLHSNHSMGPFGADHPTVKSGLKRFYCPVHQHFMMVPCSHKHSSKNKKAFLIGPYCSGNSQAPISLIQIGGDQIPFAKYLATIQDTNHTTPYPLFSYIQTEVFIQIEAPPKISLKQL